LSPNFVLAGDCEENRRIPYLDCYFICLSFKNTVQYSINFCWTITWTYFIMFRVIMVNKLVWKHIRRKRGFSIPLIWLGYFGQYLFCLQVIKCKSMCIYNCISFCISFNTHLLWPREFWMIFKGTGFFAVVWFGSSPTPSPPLSTLDRQHTGRLERQLSHGRGGWGLGEEPNHSSARKPGPL
jgi:hypothetical protein